MDSSPTLLITRPEDDARQFAVQAEAAGFTPIFEPLLQIEPLRAPVLPDGALQALLFTSANGVRAFVQAYGVLERPAYAVGDATANAAKAAGFVDVCSAGGDVNALAALVQSRLEPSAGLLIHPAGQAVAGDLQGTLENAGYKVVRMALYRALKAPALTDMLIERIYSGSVDHAAFFSPRTAAAFVRLAQSAGIGDKMGKTAATALSPNVAMELAALNWRSIDAATEPTQEALLAKLLQVKREAASTVTE
jgi:uroporphyrinogen-III synthase